MFLAAFRHNPLFRAAAWLSLWLLLLPALVPLVHHPATANAMQGMPDCHMAMGDMGGNHKPDTGKSQAPCPICQSLSLLAHGFVAPPALAVRTPVFAPVFAASLPEAAPVSASPLSFWPRGPPILA